EPSYCSTWSRTHWAELGSYSPCTGMSILNTATSFRNSTRAGLRTPTRGPISSPGDPSSAEGWAPLPSSPDEARETVAVAVLGRRGRRGRRRRQLVGGSGGGRRDRRHRRWPFHGRLGGGGGGLLRGLDGLLASLGGAGLSGAGLGGSGLGGARLGGTGPG